MLRVEAIESGNVAMHENLFGALADFSKPLGLAGARIAQNAARRIRMRPTYQPPLAPGPSLSTTGIAVSNLQKLSVTIGTPLPYAEIQHDGGTIFPKTGKALAIPERQSLIAKKLWPRDIDPDRKVLKFIPSITGVTIGVLIDKEGVLGHGKGILYVLVAKSVIVGQPYFYRGNELFEEDYEILELVMGAHLDGSRRV